MVCEFYLSKAVPQRTSATPNHHTSSKELRSSAHRTNPQRLHVTPHPCLGSWKHPPKTQFKSSTCPLSRKFRLMVVRTFPKPPFLLRRSWTFLHMSYCQGLKRSSNNDNNKPIILYTLFSAAGVRPAPSSHLKSDLYCSLLSSLEIPL